MTDANTTDAAATNDSAITLTAIEARVLGCLVEKEATTPDNYPLTLNATTTACNQKTSREPVMQLEPGQVGRALRELENKKLVRHDFSARAERYHHRAGKVLELTRAQLALVALLLLRGPQTVSELLARTRRLHEFDDADEVDFNLQRLAQKQPPLATLMPRQPGQRGQRWAHLLSGPVKAEAPDADAPHSPPAPQAHSRDVLDRLDDLEQRVAELEERLGGEKPDA
ncbi:MAG TPA: YceH family protein [Wenzhouxiangella sp.]|nr:YceH family protein [Wenzhouxiangella sp.]